MQNAPHRKFNMVAVYPGIIKIMVKGNVMGKGLSFLQEQILILALHRGGMVSVADILNSLWEPAGENGTQTFSRSGVGPGDYGQIHSTLSRSVERLRLRGLTRTFKDVSGSVGTIIALTAFGRQVAQEIAEAEEEEEEAGPE